MAEVRVDGMVTPTADMLLYEKRVTGEQYNRDRFRYVDIITTKADEYLCKTFRNVLAKALGVPKEEVADAAELAILELAEIPGNEDFDNKFGELVEQIQHIAKLAEGGSLNEPKDLKRPRVTIGDLCKLLEGAKFGEQAEQMAQLRAKLERVMQGEATQEHCRELAKKALEREMEGINEGVSGSSAKTIARRKAKRDKKDMKDARRKKKKRGR
ncbi:hypothetical protein KJ742_04585 [Patescibacteria group bacterium]|nr:hypothetical protein [Patescibacteria group bacterium]MBU1683196.1 hypothetical protein [Patescibacteria group bacterium]MBU1935556.1 hypothetical protein [Patescibacteria group bacterium]